MDNDKRVLDRENCVTRAATGVAVWEPLAMLLDGDSLHVDDGFHALFECGWSLQKRWQMLFTVKQTNTADVGTFIHIHCIAQWELPYIPRVDEDAADSVASRLLLLCQHQNDGL